MKLIRLLTTLLAIFVFTKSSVGQVFWTETFGTGCNSGTLANGYVTPNGTWDVTATGFNGTDANLWYISAEENGEGFNNCGAGCGTNPTLHIGRADGDVGATYLKDNATGDPRTDIRAESPVIDCSNQCQILLSFELIHNGDADLDNCILWYFNGNIWFPLDSPKKTLLTCTPLGFWQDYSIYLPSSANNNPNVRIGFQWINNDDGIGIDPSIAIYNIELRSDDTESPAISCASNLDVYLNGDCEALIPDFFQNPAAIVADNCTPILDLVVTQDIAAGSVLSGLSSTQVVEVTVMDLAGNTNSCLINVNAVDTISPVLDCPILPVPAYANSGCTAQLANFSTQLNPIDNCNSFIDLAFSQSPAVGTTISADQAVNLVVTDQSGNSRSCSFTVEFLDTISPLIICPSNQIQETSSGSCDTLILDYRNMILWSDNCTPSFLDMTFVQSPSPMSLVSGINMVEISALDPSGNSNSCFFELEVIDVESPNITCPANQTQPTNSACNINLDDYTGVAVVLDNCSSIPNVLVNQSPAIGSVQTGLGSFVQVTLTASDESGNLNTCIFEVELIDTTSPEAFCPTNITVDANANCEYVLTDFTSAMAATDNCTGSGNFVFTQQTAIGSIFSVGNHEVFMIAEDESGNTGTCSFFVEVVDVTNPTIIDCAPDQTVLLEANCEGLLGDYTVLVNAVDGCSAGNLIFSQSPAPGTVVTTDLSVTITVSDLNTNTTQCVFTVNVEDQEAPSIICPDDTIVSVNSVCEYVAPDVTAVVLGTDNCSALSNMLVTQSPLAGTLLTGIDQIEVTLTDEAGNSTSCLIETIPNDIEAPIISCPTDELINIGVSCDFVIPDYATGVNIVENCPGYILTQMPSVGSSVSIGNHEILFTISDIGGNEQTCSFFIEVVEDEVPTIICPPNIVQCDSLVNYTLPVATDNCVTLSLNQTDLSGLSSGNIFPLGITEQTYEVVDESGNTASCSFSIEILESPDIAQIIDTPISLCDTTSVVLSAEAVNSGTGEWFVITGGGTLNNQFSNVTGANNLDFGVNQFVWEVSSVQCGSLSDTVTITVFDLPFPASIPNDSLLVCYDTLVNITANTPNVGLGTWSSPNESISFLNENQSNTEAYNLSAGWNDIIWGISNGSCPVSRDTVIVFLVPNAEILNIDTTLCITDGAVQLTGNNAPIGVGSFWYIIQGSANIVSNQNSESEMNGISAGENLIVYSLIYPDCGNSFDTLMITIEECEEYNPEIPTVFTPNNDGKNDLFIIDNLHLLYPECEVKIVNRWGSLVFESLGYLDPWDGTLLGSGELLPVGTYFYRIYLNNDSLTEITGSISIIR